MSKKTAVVLGGILLLTASMGGAEEKKMREDAKASISWSDKNCFTLNWECGKTNSCKPQEDWDSQDTDQSQAPLKLVKHRGGQNPEIWYRCDTAVTAKTPADYATSVRASYAGRGLKVDAVEKIMVGGKEIFTVCGADEAKKARNCTALFPSGNKALQLEVTASDTEFAKIQPEWKATVSKTQTLP